MVNEVGAIDNAFLSIGTRSKMAHFFLTQVMGPRMVHLNTVMMPINSDKSIYLFITIANFQQMLVSEAI